MDWNSLLSTKRLGDQTKPLRLGRTEFQSDLDRAIFSSSFRRLGRKTQVHPLAANDHIHTRLTHSLEVSRVGRALGTALATKIQQDEKRHHLRLPDGIQPQDIGDIVQAACLIHDVGNPPFGHAGEAAVKNWFHQNGSVLIGLTGEERFDIETLEGNAQGFRTITQLENYIFAGGLRLTYAVLGSFHKYPWSSRSVESGDKEKFGAYLSEEEILRQVCEGLGMVETADNRWCRHPLAHLVEAADDICYALIDVEDAVELGIVKFSEAKDLFLSILTPEERHEVNNKLRTDTMHRVNFARLRGPVFENAVGEIVKAFFRSYGDVMNGSYSGDVLSMLDNDSPLLDAIKSAKRLGRDRIYLDTKKVELEIGCYAIFDILLRNFCEAAIAQSDAIAGKGRLGWRESKIMGLLGEHAPAEDNAPSGGWTKSQCIRRAIDFVAGMTDNYAVYIAKQLRGDAFAGLQRP